jgi:hypothetical protein
VIVTVNSTAAATTDESSAVSDGTAIRYSSRNVVCAAPGLIENVIVPMKPINSNSAGYADQIRNLNVIVIEMLQDSEIVERIYLKKMLNVNAMQIHSFSVS